MSDFRTTPGNLVRARGRDWVVQAGSDETVLVLRPLRGGDDVVYIAPDLQQEPVRAAVFDDPKPSQLLNMRSGTLFRGGFDAEAPQWSHPSDRSTYRRGAENLSAGTVAYGVEDGSGEAAHRR